MEYLTIALASGIAVSVAAILAQRRARAQAIALSARVLPALKSRGALTVPELMETLDMRGIQAQGKILMALASLVREGRVAEIPIPPGTRQLDKIKVRKYTASPQLTSNPGYH
jgi:hypothetical protein